MITCPKHGDPREGQSRQWWKSPTSYSWCLGDHSIHIWSFPKTRVYIHWTHQFSKDLAWKTIQVLGCPHFSKPPSWCHHQFTLLGWCVWIILSKKPTENRRLTLGSIPSYPSYPSYLCCSVHFRPGTLFSGRQKRSLKNNFLWPRRWWFFAL